MKNNTNLKLRRKGFYAEGQWFANKLEYINHLYVNYVNSIVTELTLA